MSERFWSALMASSVAAAFTSLGIFTIRHLQRWAERNAIYFIGFAAGVLIAASFLHLIPRALELSRQGAAFLLGGYLFLNILHRCMPGNACGQESPLVAPVGVIAIVGIGLHSFIDGAIYSVTFTASIFTGALAAVGMVLHEFPEGIITYLLLVQAGYDRRAATPWALFAAALSTPLGMLVSYPAVQYIHEVNLGDALAFLAGALVYVGATHLMPTAEAEGTWRGLIALAGGISVAVVVSVAGH